MKKSALTTFLVATVAVFGVGSASAAGKTQIEICHIPPGNPADFHTIKISEKAFSAHLAHGDLGGACNAACATLCNDGNACTIDDTDDCEQAGCPTTPELVDCNDQNECTADSCNSASGCVNTARLGETCDDGQVCSGPDTCNAGGTCQGAAIDGCCLGDGDCSQDPCDRASCDTSTNRCGKSPVVCIPPDLCTVSTCAPDTGLCVESAKVCAEAETCNSTTGECAPTGVIEIVCPGVSAYSCDLPFVSAPITASGGAGEPYQFGVTGNYNSGVDWGFDGASRTIVVTGPDIYGYFSYTVNVSDSRGLNAEESCLGYISRCGGRSDARLKRDITPLSYGLHEVLQLRPVRWQWNDPSTPQVNLGLVAQDVKPVLPELIVRNVDGKGSLGLDYMGLLPVVVKSIQEQQDTITALRAENATLVQQAASLEARLKALEQALLQQAQSTRTSR